MRVLLFAAFFSSYVLALQPIDEIFRKYVNHSTDPCDNFYRHTCPLNTSTGPLVNLIKKSLTPKKDGFRSAITILKSGRNLTEGRENEYKLMKTRCEEGKSLDILFELEQLPNHLRNEKNCTRLANLIAKGFEPNGEYMIAATNEFNTFGKKIHYLVNAIEFIESIIEYKLADAIVEMRVILDRIFDKAEDWISETPWVKNNNESEVIDSALDAMKLYDNYEDLMKTLKEKIQSIENDYKNCKSQFDNLEESNILCFLVAMSKDKTGDDFMQTNDQFWFGSTEEAFNLFPNISMGSVYYTILKNTTEMAAKLGSVGFVAAHEVSHTLIADRKDRILPYFSENSVQCVQNQFQQTCDTFKENSCVVEDVQIDENGSDILGMQIAHALFEEYYDHKLCGIYEPLNITYHQLFFYARAFLFCDSNPEEIQYNPPGSNKIDVHSTFGVRLNVIAQHPGFKKAFHCPDDSRMMKSATEECIIYGKGAPENKRRK